MEKKKYSGTNFFNDICSIILMMIGVALCLTIIGAIIGIPMIIMGAKGFGAD